MKYLFSLFFVFLIFNLSFSQTFGWVKSGLGNDEIISRKIIVAQNQDYIVGGEIKGSGTFGNSTINSLGNSDLFVCRYDSSGQLKWVNRYGGFEDDELGGISETVGGRIMVCGTYEGNTTIDTVSLINVDGENGFVAQFDSSGNVIWVINVESSDEVGISGLYSSSSDSLIYIIGHFKDSLHIDSQSFVSFGDESFFVAALDFYGSLIWLSEATSQDEVTPKSIFKSNNTINITGEFEGNMLINGGVFSNSSDKDMFVAQYDAGGQFNWAKSVGGSDDVKGEVVVSDDSGNLYLTGNFKGDCIFLSDTLINQGDKDGFLLKLDPNGNEVWVKQFSGSSDVVPIGMCLNSNSELLITGRTESTAYFDSLSVTNNSGTDAFICKYNSSGTVQWTKGVGGSSTVEGSAICVGADNHPVVTGVFSGVSFFDTISLNGFNSYDFFIAKIYPGNVSSSNQDFSSNENINFFAYPNPTKDFVYFNSPFDINKKCTVRLTDQKGASFKGIFIENNKMDISSLADGIYFVEILDEQQSFRVKITKQ